MIDKENFARINQNQREAMRDKTIRNIILEHTRQTTI